MLKICAISDTHCRHSEFTIPRCDILIHAGDSTFFGRPDEISNFVAWFEKQPATYRIMIAGNHELGLDDRSPKFHQESRRIVANADLLYLEDSWVNIRGVKIYGTPWTPKFYDWGFNGTVSGDIPTPQQPLLREIYRDIPDDTNILVCHTPAYGIVDKGCGGNSDERLGSYDMRNRISKLKDLHLYICGHIHEAHGRDVVDDVLHCNVACLKRDYCTHNPVTIIYLDELTGLTTVEDGPLY